MHIDGSVRPTVSPDGVTDVTSQSLYMLKEFNETGKKFEYYGYYKDENGAEKVILTELTIPYNKDNKPGIVNTDKYKNIYKSVDDSYENYISNHRYTNPYRH